MAPARRWILFSDFPSDIAESIIQLAAQDFKTAHALAATSKTLSYWAIPLLYSKVSLLTNSAADKFLVALDSSPIRGQHVRHLTVTTFFGQLSDRDLVPDILSRTTELRSLVWKGCHDLAFPRESLPSSLRTLNVYFMFFERRKWLGDDLSVIPCFWNITELQITAQFEWDRDDSFLQRLSLQPLPSLEYLSLRPPTPIWTSAELIAHIRTILIPQFPQSLKVCILYDGLWRDSSENRGSLSNEMKQLIMGYVDERIILATDKQVKLSPSAPYSDFLVKLPSYDPFVGHLCSKTAHTWTEIVSLMKRRKELRGVWKQQFPRIGTKVKVKNHAARLTTADWMLLVACAVPVLVWMGGEAVWRKIRN